MALLTSACRSGGAAATRSATVPTEPSTTTTIDPYAVPDVIDVAYVNQVLAGLDAPTGGTFRLCMRARRITPEISERIKAAYGSGEAYDLKVRTFEGVKDTQLSAEPGNQITTVTRLITATSGLHLRASGTRLSSSGRDRGGCGRVGCAPATPRPPGSRSL